MYYYLFYRLYRFYENAPAKWSSDWKAELTIDALEVSILLSIFVYYTVFTKNRIDFGNGSVVIITYLALIAIPNYFIFQHRDRWRKYVSKFQKWPKGKNKIGGFFVFFFIALVVVNFIFSYYLLSQINWKNY